MSSEITQVVTALTSTAATSFGWKMFLNFANSLSPPYDDCPYWTGVAYDFVQNVASNKGLAGKRRSR